MSNIVTGAVRRLFVVSVAVAVALLPLVPPAVTPAQAAPVGPGPGAPGSLEVAGPTLINTPTATRTPTPINVGNFVWDDLDNDGRQDAGEPGLPGVSVQLWNGAKTQMIGTAVTNANGNYALVAPLPGEYRVRVLLPGANDQFSPKDNAAAGDTADSDVNPSGTSLGFTDIYAFASNVISIVSIDAGIMVWHAPTATRTPTPINVGNFVWDDLDNDGRQDAGEPGLPGVTVQLWNGAKTQMIGTAVTNANGNYSLIAPLPGEYRVRVLLPGANDQFSPKDNAAAGDTADSDVNPSGTSLGFTDIYAFASNVISIVSIDAGIMVLRAPTATRTPTPINVGNFVWDDMDNDGRQDAGEPGLPGVTVQLWNGAKTQMIGTAVTNTNGNYSLVAPLPGGYRVRVLLPGANDQFSPKDNAAAGDTADSDINPSGTSLGFTDIYTFASNVISIVSIDAGIMLGPATSTPTATRTATRTTTKTPGPAGSATPTATLAAAAPTPSPTHMLGLGTPSPTKTISLPYRVRLPLILSLLAP